MGRENPVQAELQHMRMENTRLRLRLAEAGLGLTSGAQLLAKLPRCCDAPPF